MSDLIWCGLILALLFFSCLATLTAVGWFVSVLADAVIRGTLGEGEPAPTTLEDTPS